MPGNVLVGGGTGFIGQHLCKALKTKKYGVTIISRMPGPKNISWNDLNSKGLPKDTVGVVNLAGQNVMDFTQRWTSGFKQNVFNSRVNTTLSLANAINKAPSKPKAFVVMSGVGVYKPDLQKEYTEIYDEEPFDYFSKLVIEWEKAAKLNKSSENLCRVVNIRSGVVLGRSGGMIKQLLLPFSLGLGGPIGNGSQFMPWIHIEDLINLIIFSIENETVKGVLNGVAPQICSNKDFCKAFARSLNRPALIPVPTFLFNFLLGNERAKMVTEGQKVIPRRTRELGFQYLYPTIEEACQNIVKVK